MVNQMLSYEKNLKAILEAGKQLEQTRMFENKPVRR